VAAHQTARGTHTGDFAHPVLGTAPASGKPVAFTYMDQYRIAGGKIAEAWEVRDGLTLLQQLGVLAAPGQASALRPRADRGTQSYWRHGMSTEENKALIRRLYDGLNRGDLAAMDALIAPDFAYNGQVIGPEGVKQHITATRAAFPDLSWTIEDMLADGDKVVTRYTYSGTHHGELMGIPPTGKSFRATGIAIDHIAGGKIADEWETRDTLGALQQLGVLPGSGPRPG
jgi:steroid delta-isomerase-like uncharacterized protein